MTSATAGKTFWLDRKVRLWTRSQLGGLIARRGGSVADEIVAGLDFVVLDTTRRTAPGQSEHEQEAARLGVAVLYLDDLHALLRPGRDEALELLRAGPAGREPWEAVLPLASSPVEIDLAEADLRGLDLSGFTFRRCDLAGALLDGANLDGATFLGPHDVVFRKAGSMRGATLSSARRCDFDGLDLTGARLDGRFEQCTFRRTTLRGAEAASVELVECVATEADFGESDFGGCQAVKLNAVGLRCVGARMSRADFRESPLDGADFSGATLEEAVFAGARLGQANFARATLSGADFGEADVQAACFRGANLAKAKFTEARTRRADFAGANVRGVVDLSRSDAKKKGGATPVRPMPTPATPPEPEVPERLAALRDALAQAASWTLEFALVGAAERGLQRWTFETVARGRVRVTCASRGEPVQSQTDDWVQALLDMVMTQREALPQVDTVRVLPRALGESLELLPFQAICQLFALPLPTELPVSPSLATGLASGAEALFRRGDVGLRLWNASTEMERRALAVLGTVDLSGLELPGIELAKLDATGINLTGSDLGNANLRQTTLRHARLRRARLKGASLNGADCRGADAAEADLSEASLQETDWRGATLQGACLKKAHLQSARFQAADLSGADLDGVQVNATQYDDGTIFPEGFKPGNGWLSTSADAGPAPADYNALLSMLPMLFGGRRWPEVQALLRGGIAPLWAEADAEGVRGVVPAESKSPAFHACRLTSAGGHGCATQDLTPCPDTRQGMCRHVLALLLDLVRRERVAPGDALRWARLSLAHEGCVDRDALGAVFTRYAESTQTDYRPNETLPEDYYAL